MEQAYLGDSVYVKMEGDGYVRLYLDNGYGPKHEIALEAEVIDVLMKFLKQHNVISDYKYPTHENSKPS